MKDHTCPKCSTTLLAHATREQTRDGLHCPDCETLYLRPLGFTGCDLVDAPRIDIAGGRVIGLPFEMMLQPDGTVDFALKTPGRVLKWRMSVDDVSRLKDSTVYVEHNAKRLRDKLTGADRWQFRRAESGNVIARLIDEEREIEPFTVGRRAEGRRAPSCTACDAEIAPGSRAYRPTRFGSGRVSWGSVRFCAKCAGAVKEEPRKGPPVLRLLDGGKGAVRKHG